MRVRIGLSVSLALAAWSGGPAEGGAVKRTHVEVWKHNPEAWDAVRIQAGKLLHEAASR